MILGNHILPRRPTYQQDTKTRKRTEDTAADRVNYGDSYSAKKVDPDPMCLTSFDGDSTKPPALPCRDDAMVDKGTAALKPCLSLVEMRTLTAAGGLRPTGTATTAKRAIFHQLSLWFCPTKEMNFRTTPTQYTTTYSSF